MGAFGSKSIKFIKELGKKNHITLEIHWLPVVLFSISLSLCNKRMLPPFCLLALPKLNWISSYLFPFIFLTP